MGCSREKAVSHKETMLKIFAGAVCHHENWHYVVTWAGRNIGQGATAAEAWRHARGFVRYDLPEITGSVVRVPAQPFKSLQDVEAWANQQRKAA